MSPETNKAIVLHMLEDLRARRLGSLDGHPAMAPLKPFFSQMFAAFPDASVEVKEMPAEGEWVACRMIQRGTHREVWQDVPATGRSAEWEILATFRLLDGQIVEPHAQADTLGMLRQLGASDAPAAH